MSEVLSETEAKELLRLCKVGRLFDVQNWIGSGKSLCVPDDLRTYPLKVALDTGFHSLVELLVRNETSQELKDRALSHALSLKRLDFIQLLVSQGAAISSVPFIDVLRIWEELRSQEPLTRLAIVAMAFNIAAVLAFLIMLFLTTLMAELILALQRSQALSGKVIEGYCTIVDLLKGVSEKPKTRKRELLD